MDVLVGILIVSVLFVAAAALIGGAVAKLLFDFVAAPLREDNDG